MLPDYPGIKGDLSAHLDEFLQERHDFHLGPLSDIRRIYRPEGSGGTVWKRSSGDTDETQMQQLSAEFQMSREELQTITLDDLLAKLDSMAKDVAGQMAQSFYRSVSEAVDKVGNVVSAKGQKLSAELLLEAFSKIQIDFNLDGTPKLPEMHFHPKMREAAELAFRELDSNPTLKKQMQEILRRKRDEWSAREASRRLVG